MAFRVIMDRYHSLAYSVVIGVVGNRDIVDDVLQDIFIKVYRGMPRFRADAKLSTWIYRIARNEAINAVKRPQIAGDSVDDVVIAASEHERPDAQYQRSEQQKQLEGYLGQLDESYRIALELRYLGEKSYAEIAETMDLPLGTVKTYIHRGKAELKRVMSKRTPDGERKNLGP